MEKDKSCVTIPVDKVNKLITEVYSWWDGYSWKESFPSEKCPYIVLEDIKSSNYNKEEQDKIGERFVVFDTFEECGYYLKVKIESDSYGDEKGIVGVKFCKPVKKEILTYE